MGIKTVERREMKEVTVTKYVTSDGKEYNRLDDAERHEKYLNSNDYYVQTHAMQYWSEDYSGLPGYFECDSGSLYLIEVDDRVIEWAHKDKYNGNIDHIEDYKGQLVFISMWDSYSKFLWGSIDDAIRDFARDLKQLTDWKEEFDKNHK